MVEQAFCSFENNSFHRIARRCIRDAGSFTHFVVGALAFCESLRG
jgi:hypothetical protein